MPGYYQPEMKEETEELLITGEEFHHLIHVCRSCVGETIILNNGRGLLAEGIIKNIGRGDALVKVVNTRNEKPSLPRLAAAFSLLQNKNDLLLVEKLTELGVKELFPLITRRTVRKCSENTEQKFQKAAISAIKQCDNSILPHINTTRTLQYFLDNLDQAAYQPLVALESEGHQQLASLLSSIPAPGYCLIIGPEGGFDQEEKAYFLQQSVPAFTLGNHILRAETAAITAMAQAVGFFLAMNPEYY